MALADFIPSSTINTTGATGSVLVPFLMHLWGWVPSVFAAVGAGLGIIWYCLMIWESDTVKAWQQTRAARKKLRRLHYLKAEQGIIQAELAELDPSPMVTVATATATVPAVPRGTDLRERPSPPPVGDGEDETGG